MRRLLTVVALAAALAATSVPGSARAESVRSPGGLLDGSPQDRSQMLSVFGFLPWASGFGVAGRYAIPIVPQGFIPKLNDSLELEFGADFYQHWGFDYWGFIVPIEARWTFHITPKFAAYGKVSAGFQYDSDWRWGGIDFVHVDLNPGVIYQFTEAVAFRAEFGYHGLRAGVGFNF